MKRKSATAKLPVREDQRPAVGGIHQVQSLDRPLSRGVRLYRHLFLNCLHHAATLCETPSSPAEVCCMPETFGTRLRQQREQRQIALRSIANKTKISIGLLEGLERDDVS